MLSLTQQFLAFCRSKPAGEEYDAGDACKCALAQFGYSDATLGSREMLGIPMRMYTAAAYEKPSTFGALTARLEAALVDQVLA